MAFVVETGAGLNNSNAYATVEFVDAYHTDRGNTKWTGITAAKQAVIIRASDYIDKRFGRKFRGTKLLRDQAMNWPRTDAYDDSGFPYETYSIPERLMQAVAEYALRALLLGELAPDVPPNVPPMNNTSGSTSETNVAGGTITLKREVIGPLEEETRYSDPSSSTSTRAGISSLVSSGSIPEYPAADLLLDELVKSSNSRRIVRG